MPLHNMLYTSLNSLFRDRSSVPQPILVFSPPRSHLNSFPSPLVHFFCTLEHLEKEDIFTKLWEKSCFHGKTQEMEARSKAALFIYFQSTETKFFPYQDCQTNVCLCSAFTIISKLCLLQIESVFSVKESFLGDLVVE